MTFETYWLLVPSVGTVVVLIGCLVLWLTRPGSRNVASAAPGLEDLLRQASAPSAMAGIAACGGECGD